MRLFIALDLDDSIREQIARFMDGVREFTPDARWVRPESLHITLKFIGEQRDERVEPIKLALSGIQADTFEMSLRGCGFFPTPKSARVFWIGIDAPPLLADLARKVEESLETLRVAKETHAFSPHLTLARGGSGSGAPRRNKHDHANRDFQRLQEKLRALPEPEFGTMTAREFFLYQSQLGRGGSRYVKLAGFKLR